MASLQDDTSQLLIRCPSCGQRFKVGVELRERTVECGACEHRFRITDEVVVRAKKFYPGERAGTLSNRYHRVPIAAPPPEGLQMVHYSEQGDPSSFEPTSPLRLIAGAGGVLLVVSMAMLLFFGARNGGALDGMPTLNRMVMAGFTAVLAGVLLVYANPRARVRAVVGGILCAVLLLSLPLLRTEGSAAVGTGAGTSEPAVESKPVDKPDPEAVRIAKLREEICTKPLEDEEARLKASGSEKWACGIWLRGLSGEHKLLVRDYLLRTLKAEGSHPYPREQSYLIVVSGLPRKKSSNPGLSKEYTIEELAKDIKPLGELVAIRREINVIEVRVDPDSFNEVPIEKLNDKSKPAFYELNKRELESIDLTRVGQAVTRLAGAEPKLYRTDIGRRLASLLSDDAVDFKADVCDALLVWADESVEAGEPAEVLLRHLDKTKAEIPTSLVALLAKERRVAVIPVVMRLWLQDASKWESIFLSFGGAVEGNLIAEFPTMDNAGRKAAVPILGKVGGKDSLPLLETARQGADSEMKVRIEAADKAIRERLEK